MNSKYESIYIVFSCTDIKKETFKELKYLYIKYYMHVCISKFITQHINTILFLYVLILHVLISES